MFKDPWLPNTAQDKGAEVEAGFLTMANLLVMLSSLSAEYKTAKQAVPASTLVTKAPPLAPPKPPQEPPAIEPQAEVKEGGGGAEVGKDETNTTAAEPGAEDVIAVSQPEPARGSSEGSKDIAAARDRTPPPGKAAKAVAKKSDEELLGPRRHKAGAGTA